MTCSNPSGITASGSFSWLPETKAILIGEPFRADRDDTVPREALGYDCHRLQ
jgi:hypothetical protein